MIITRCENCHRLANIEKMTAVTLAIRRPEGLTLANEAMEGMMSSIAKVAPPGAMMLPSKEDDIPKSAPIAVSALLCGVCFRGMELDPDGRAPDCEVDFSEGESNVHGM